MEAACSTSYGSAASYLPRHPRPCLLASRTAHRRRFSSVRNHSLATKERILQACIEKTTWNSRTLYTCVDINAPVSTVWGCLTDYDNLGTFIPSLVENKCLERRQDGCILHQVGAADVAMGVKFSAKCRLDITEHIQGLPDDMISTEYHNVKEQLPFPSTSLDAPAQDISFTLLEGDFEEFKGVWRMQQSKKGSDWTLLSYAVYVLPQKWLPVGIVQGRIATDITKNLDAVRRHAEQLHADSTGAAAM